jgi:STE24 endopeptidase
VLVTLGAAWLVAAALLWRSSVVPDDLRIPDLDVSSQFSADELAEAQRYERFVRIEWVLSQLALLGVLAVYARRGTRLMKESAAGPIGTGMVLGMLGLAIAWLVQVPFSIVSLWWDRRHDLSDASYWEQVLGDWLLLGGEFLFICFALLVVMALARWIGRWWWVAAAPVFVGLVALFVFVSPYLVTDTSPLDDPQLEAAARDYAREQGIEPIRVEVENVHGLTSAPNAEATGLGPSRRIFLWDTLLDGRFSDDEVRVVLAHELGHHSRHHLPKGIAWYALLALPGTWLIALAVRRRGGMGEPEAVPLALFVLVALGLVALPFENIVTRRVEAEADWVALQTTRDPAAAQGLFRAFTGTTLSDPSPPTWAYVLLDTHPTIEQRIEMARAWRAREATR